MRSITRHGPELVLGTGRGEVLAGAVIACAGLQADRVAALADEDDDGDGVPDNEAGHDSDGDGRTDVIDDDDDILTAARLLLRRRFAEVLTCRRPERIPDLLERRYNGTARLLGTLAIVLAYVTIAAYQFRGGGWILSIVTDGAISPDLGIAKAYLSIFPGEGAEETLKNISEKAGLVRNVLGKKLRNQLRHIPQFTFYLDDSLDYIDRIEDLLKDE